MIRQFLSKLIHGISADQLALNDYREAQINLLEAERIVEHYQAIATSCKACIERLEGRMK